MNNEYKLTTPFELEILSALVVLPLIHYEIQIYDQLNKVKGAEKNFCDNIICQMLLLLVSCLTCKTYEVEGT